jgi:hypothetical protein
MPHLVYTGDADLAAVCAAFIHRKTESNGWIIRMPQAYLAANGRALLVECTAVRSGFVQTFYALVEKKGASLTIRVDPHTVVERNEGVKRCLLAVRDLVIAENPALQLDKTNLEAELLNPDAFPLQP